MRHFTRAPRAAAALLAVFTACTPRVELPKLPPKDAPREVRQEALEALTPVELPDHVLSRHMPLRFEGAKAPFIWLANGTEVWDPLDLAAVLPPDTGTVGRAL
jgi:hypothetical protein